MHGALAARADPEAPTCVTCHDHHYTPSKKLPDSPTFARNQPALCGQCHQAGKRAALRIGAERGDLIRLYQDSIHGKGLVESGLLVAATCTDCHGSHDEQPAKDPRSMLSHDHVVGTCAKCHPGSHRRFAGYLSHATHHDPDKYPWLFWSFWGMTLLLVGTLTAAFLHALACLVRLWRSREQWRAHRKVIAEAVGRGGKVYCRFDRSLSSTATSDRTSSRWTPLSSPAG